MSISGTNRIAGPFIGANTTNTFPFNFKVFQASDLVVKTTVTATGITTTGTLGTDYSVALNSNQDSAPGGTYTLLVATVPTNLPIGSTQIATTALPNLQPTVITNAGGFFPQVINDSLDRATIQIQQLAASIGNSVQAPVTDGNFPMVLPTAALRANGFLSFDSLGNPTVSSGVASVTVSTAMVPVVGAASLAAAQTALFGTTPLSLALGGTAANTVLGARTNLGPGLNSLTYAGGSISGANDAFEFYSASASAVRKGAVQDILGTTHGLSTKTTPVGADEILIQDSAASFASKKALLSTIISGAVKNIAVQRLTSSTTYTPSPNLIIACFRLVGGGGGATGGSSGPNYGSGGGAGAFVEAWATAATIGASQSATVGAAGTANTGLNAATAGGTTSIGAIASAGGGQPGLTSASSVTILGGAGGTASNPSIGYAVNGQPGFAGQSAGAVTGAGGSSPFGAGGQAVTSGGTGNPGTGNGSGGSGGNSTNSGGAGTVGFIEVTEYLSA